MRVFFFFGPSPTLTITQGRCVFLSSAHLFMNLTTTRTKIFWMSKIDSFNHRTESCKQRDNNLQTSKLPYHQQYRRLRLPERVTETERMQQIMAMKDPVVAARLGTKFPPRAVGSKAKHLIVFPAKQCDWSTANTCIHYRIDSSQPRTFPIPLT